MITIADNPSVRQQLAQLNEAGQLPDSAIDTVTQSTVDNSASPAYPSKKLELIEGRYRVLGTEK